MEKQTVTFKFVRGPALAVGNVNGYWVSTTPAGKLLVDMFYQHPKRTESITFLVDDTGTVGKETARDVPDIMVREILSSLEITPELAMDFGTFLVETARSMGVKSPGEEPGLSVTKQ